MEGSSGGDGLGLTTMSKSIIYTVSFNLLFYFRTSEFNITQFTLIWCSFNDKVKFINWLIAGLLLRCSCRLEVSC